MEVLSGLLARDGQSVRNRQQPLASMDARPSDEYHGARVAPVAQLDRVLPSEGRGRGFESRLVHHIVVWMFFEQSEKNFEEPAMCGLFCFW